MAIYNEKDKTKWTKDNRHYQFRVYYTDKFGNRKQKESKMYMTSAEAKEQERLFLNAVSTTDIVESNIEFNFVVDEWLSFKEPTVKSSTFYGLKKRVGKHIIPYFKKYKLHSVKINVLNDWKSNLAKNNLSLGHQNTIIQYLIEILAYAVNNYDFDIKVSSKLQKHKIEQVKTTLSSSEENFFTYQEFQTFIKEVDDAYYNLIFNFLYYTGLRIGEAIALNWNDINFSKKTLKVNKTYTENCFGEIFRITTPKTTNSNRIIDLDDLLLNMLKSHYAEESNLYGFTKDMFVFGNIKHLAPTTITRKLKYYIEKSQVKRITLHGFRHSHVSLLIDLGCSSIEIANRVGDTITMIEKTYAHLFPDKKNNTINVLNNLKNKG